MENQEQNVTPIKKPPTDQEALSELHKTCSRLFFEYGQLAYEIECKKGELGGIEVKLRNANTEAYNLSMKIKKNEADKLTVEEPKNENH